MTADALWQSANPDTPSDVLEDLKTVDGAGSGLDADLLDGLHGSAYLAGSAGERRYAYANPYLYLGTAPADTLDSAETWTLTRLTLAADGTVTITETATDAWNDRVTATYA